MGKNKNCPIKVEFVTQLKKKGILQNTRKLKNTGVSIVHDLTTIQQEELKVLKRHLEKERKLNINKKSFIKGNRLVTEAATFTVQELLNSEEIEDLPDYTKNTASSTKKHITPIVNVNSVIRTRYGSSSLDKNKIVFFCN
ncbi:hypothetical protein JTB14_026569 [Gonioctena quinquepunctata]|nr:hypothetical protein JTB14_026569 [Gonioctena quinquepunctata]